MKLKKDSPLERLWNGLFVENPVFVLVLGTCPTLATSTSASNAIGMGLSTTFVLMMANLLISLLRKVIPERMRMPAYIVVIASFVTMVDFLMEGFTPALYSTLGIYIPLIVVNCIIMGRAEAYAGKKPPLASFFDGLGMGIGFTVALLCISSLREIFGAGTWFGHQVMPSGYVPINIFVLAPGAFLVYALLIAVMNKLKIGAGRRPKEEWDPTVKICGDCFSCMKFGLCGKKPEECDEIPAKTLAKATGTVAQATAKPAVAQAAAKPAAAEIKTAAKASAAKPAAETEAADAKPAADAGAKPVAAETKTAAKASAAKPAAETEAADAKPAADAGTKTAAAKTGDEKTAAEKESGEAKTTGSENASGAEKSPDSGNASSPEKVSGSDKASGKEE